MTTVSAKARAEGIADLLEKLAHEVRELCKLPAFGLVPIDLETKPRKPVIDFRAPEPLLDQLAAVKPEPVAGVPVPPKGDSPDGLSKLELKICQAIFHQGPLTKPQIAYFAGISTGSGSVIRAYADLLEDGILLSEGGRLVLDSSMPRVVELTSTFAPVPPRRSVYLKAFCEREGDHIAKIVGAVLQAAPNPSFDAVCSSAGISKASGSTIKAFARLKHLGILERHRGRVEVSPWFLDANAPEVRVRDSETGAERVHNAKTGMPR